MRLSESYDGSGDPFQGERVVPLQSIPAGARILRATATVSPVDASGGANPFAETVTFSGLTGDWGASKLPAPGRWVEVDFHARRVLAGVRGSNLQNASLQVDLGGAYVELNRNGALRGPGDTAFTLPADAAAASFAQLPAIAVTRFMLSRPAAATADPDLSAVVIRSTPSNVTLRLGPGVPFWFYAGEMTQAQVTPDFAGVLQVFLDEAEAVNGFHLLPLVLHTDTVARISLALDVEFVVAEAVLPAGVTQIVLPYDYSTLPEVGADLLALDVPAASRVSPAGTSARVVGTFEETRIAYGKTGAVEAASSVEISPAATHAQPLKPAATFAATSADLLLSAARTARLQLDVRADLDGKPDGSSLLSAPATFELSAPAGRAPDEEPTATPPAWVNVKLASEFLFQEGRSYWIVLQSVEGEAAWAVEGAAAAAEEGLQSTGDGGLSWREASLDAVPRLAALLRLRRTPRRFEVPVELQVGEGTDAVRLKLDRFAPIGRVDFALDPAELSQALNRYLARLPAGACNEIEHLSDGDFEDWIRLGDELYRRAPLIITEATPAALGMSPDGSVFYAAVRFGDLNSALEVYDVDCDQRVADITLPLVMPSALAVSPDGSRVYIASTHQLQLVDATSRQQRMPLDFDELTCITMALSPDGGRLYIVGDFSGVSEGVIAHAFLVLDCAALERLTSSGQSDMSEAVVAFTVADMRPRPQRLVVSLDGTRLYLTATRADSGGELRVFDAATLDPVGEPISIDPEPRGLTLTPDGQTAIVVCTGGDSLNFVSLGKAARMSSLSLPPNARGRAAPSDVRLSPDAAHAYVLNGNGTLVVARLEDLSVVETFDLGDVGPLALAVTPQGDRLYVANERAAAGAPDEAASISSIQVGTPLLSEWELTSGRVTPVCLPEPFRLGANMGKLSRWGRKEPSAISQVVPVSASCVYDFTFWAVADGTDAYAELFWLGDDCRLAAEPLRFPIQASAAATPAPTLDATGAELPGVVGPSAPVPPLLLHRERLTSPAGASQAEVRFNVPSDVETTVGSVSLLATTERVSNPDLGLQKGGQIADWTVSPAVAPGVSLVSTPGGVQLRNASADAAELVQVVPAEGSKPFSLALDGRALARNGTSDTPALVLNWLDSGGQPAGTPVRVDIFPAGFEAFVAKGTSPADAARAEIRVRVPAGVTQEIRRVSLRFRPTTKVPVTFVSQAPGELTVLDWRVSYEPVEPAPPPIPAKGLCAATPPESLPSDGGAGGEGEGGETGFCPRCAKGRTILDAAPRQTRAGRPALSGSCVTCGGQVVRGGGVPVVGAPPLATRLSAVRPQVVKLPPRVGAVAPERGKILIPLQPFDAIKGIGEVRAQALEALGIDSIRKLAASTPAEVARARSITETLARNFIRQASEIITLVKNRST
jgi:DNA-binding beta-propeller fold protein YncE